MTCSPHRDRRADVRVEAIAPPRRRGRQRRSGWSTPPTVNEWNTSWKPNQRRRRVGPSRGEHPGAQRVEDPPDGDQAEYPGVPGIASVSTSEPRKCRQEHHRGPAQGQVHGHEEPARRADPDQPDQGAADGSRASSTASSVRAGARAAAAATANGVALPAMTRKMLAWSHRWSSPVIRGENRPRWYTADTENSRMVVRANTSTDRRR